MKLWLWIWTPITTFLFFRYLTDDVREPWIRIIFTAGAALVFFLFGEGIWNHFIRPGWKKLTRQ